MVPLHGHQTPSQGQVSTTATIPFHILEPLAELGASSRKEAQRAGEVVKDCHNRQSNICYRWGRCVGILWTSAEMILRAEILE